MIAFILISIAFIAGLVVLGEVIQEGVKRDLEDEQKRITDEY